MRAHAEGPFKCYVTKMGWGGGCQIFRKKSYEGVRFDVICVMRGWVGVQFPEKKRDVRLEWPLRHMHIHDRHMHRHTQTLAYQHAVSQLGICQYISYFEKNPNPG